MSIQQEERFLKTQNRNYYRDNQRMLDATDTMKLRPITTPVRIPAPLEPHPKPPARESGKPWIRYDVEQDCQDCAGSGRDSGSIVDDYEPCPGCNGTGREIVTRNYLNEALGLIQHPQSTRVPEREHLVALAQFFHQTVSTAHESLDALKTFWPEVA